MLAVSSELYRSFSEHGTYCNCSLLGQLLSRCVDTVKISILQDHFIMVG